MYSREVRGEDFEFQVAQVVFFPLFLMGELDTWTLSGFRNPESGVSVMLVFKKKIIKFRNVLISLEKY